MKTTYFIIFQFILCVSISSCKKINSKNNKKTTLISVIEKGDSIIKSSVNQKSNSVIDTTDYNFTNDDLKKTIHQVIKLYNEKKQSKISRLIHKDIGLYILYRRGTIDEWSNVKEICLTKICEDQLSIPWWHKEMLFEEKFDEIKEITQTKSKIFINCDSISNKGLFIVEDSRVKLLSNTMNTFKVAMSQDDDFTKDKLETLNREIISVKKWENGSKRIILVNDLKKSFVFHLANIDNKWYLTVIDFITSDCSV